MSEIQSIVFLAPSWNKTSRMRAWLKKNGLEPIKRVHRVKDEKGKVTQYRYRIKRPETYKRFRTKKTTTDINIILGFKN